MRLLTAVKHGHRERPFSLASDLPALETAVIRTGAALVVIDPVSAYLGDKDSYKDSEVRALLAPLSALADRHRVAVLAIMHLTKNEQRRAIYRAIGSIGFVAAARIVLAVVFDPKDESRSRRLLAGVKSNLSGTPPTLAYTIGGDGLMWAAAPVAGVDPDALLAGGFDPEDPADRQDADQFLRGLLADGRVPATEVFRDARKNGLSENTMRRAKRRLGVVTRHEGQPGEKGAWYWSLPEGAHAAPEDAHSGRPWASSENPAAKQKDSPLPSPKMLTPHTLSIFGEHLRGPNPVGAELPPDTEEV